jgi:hypothetical protein
MQTPAPSPQELPGSGMLLGRRYQLQAPASHSVEPGSWQAFDEVLSRPAVLQFLPPGACPAAALRVTSPVPVRRHRRRDGPNRAAAATRCYPPFSAVQHHNVVVATEQRTGESRSRWLLGNCA